MDLDPSPQTPPPEPSRSARLDWLRLFLEFVIVVVGISFSFWVQDQREQSAKRAEEVRFLDGFRGELREDLKALKGRVEAVERAVDGLRRAMDPKTRTELTVAELDWIMDAALSYIGFRGSLATYSELSQAGASSLIRDKAVLAGLIHLYERDYTQAREWDLINRGFVLERMFPYVEDHGPRVTGTIEGVYANGYHVVFQALEGETRFQNLLRTNALFKEAQVSVYEALTSKIERVIASLEP